MSTADVIEQDAQSERAMSKMQRELFDIVLGNQRSGTVRDMTRSEIQVAYERRHSRRVGEGNISGRVAELLASGYLAEGSVQRECLVTGRRKGVVYVPEKQARLFA